MTEVWNHSFKTFALSRLLWSTDFAEALLLLQPLQGLDPCMKLSTDTFSPSHLWNCDSASALWKNQIVATIYSLFLRWSWCLTVGRMSHIQFLSILGAQVLQKPYVVSSSQFSGCSKLQMIEQPVLLWSTTAAGPVGGTPQQQLRAWDDTAEPTAGGQAERWSVTVCEQCDWLGMRQGRRPTQKTNGSISHTLYQTRDRVGTAFSDVFKNNSSRKTETTLIFKAARICFCENDVKMWKGPL